MTLDRVMVRLRRLFLDDSQDTYKEKASFTLSVVHKGPLHTHIRQMQDRYSHV